MNGQSTSQENPPIAAEDWFDVQRITPGTWAISEPHHAEDGHCYLLESHDGSAALLVDTGLGVLPLGDVVRKITNAPVEVVLTHTHWDHVGGLGEFESFMVHGLEADLGHPPLPLEGDFLRAAVTEDASPLPAGFDVESYRIATWLHPSRVLADRDVISCGDRALEVLSTPGHSPGSICLLERETSLLFTGDLLYAGPLYLHLPGCDARAFAESVKRVAELCASGTVRSMLPGHNRMPLEPGFAIEVSEAASDLLARGAVPERGSRYDYDSFSLLF